jgi:hypothetical protein
MPAAEEESRVLAAVKRGIEVFVAALRKVMRPGDPDPSAVPDAQPAWMAQLDQVIMPVLETVVDHGWRWQSGQPFISGNSFTFAQLALTRNLLVRMPDDVYNEIFFILTDGMAKNQSRDMISARVDATILNTGSEWWQNRAQVITRTETNRAWNAGVLAAAQYYEPPTGPGWIKVWDADLDGHERPAHRRADGQSRGLTDTFQVGGEDLRFPGDPAGSAWNVVGCRCKMTIKKGS